MALFRFRYLDLDLNCEKGEDKQEEALILNFTPRNSLFVPRKCVAFHLILTLCCTSML